MFLGAFTKLRKASLDKHPAVGRSVCQVTRHRGQGFIPQRVAVGKWGWLVCETEGALCSLKYGRFSYRPILWHIHNSDSIIII